MKKTIFTRHSDGTCRVEFRKLTQGEALSLCNALTAHAQTSPVADDLRAFLRNAIQEDTSFQRHANADQELFNALAEPA